MDPLSSSLSLPSCFFSMSTCAPPRPQGCSRRAAVLLSDSTPPRIPPHNPPRDDKMEPDPETGGNCRGRATADHARELLRDVVPHALRRGHASPLADFDARHSKPLRGIGRPLIHAPTNLLRGEAVLALLLVELDLMAPTG